MRIKKINAGAFSLIEILLVITILSVVIGISVPRFSSSLHSAKIITIANNLVDLMRYCQVNAIATSKIYRVVFDDDFKNIRVLNNDSQSGRDPDNNFKEVALSNFSVKKIPIFIDVSCETNIINFYPQGQMDKVHLYVCYKEKCFTVSTKEMRSKVLLFDHKL